MAIYNVFYTYENHHEAVDILNWFWVNADILKRIYLSQINKTEKLLGYKITKLNA